MAAAKKLWVMIYLFDGNKLDFKVFTSKEAAMEVGAATAMYWANDHEFKAEKVTAQINKLARKSDFSGILKTWNNYQEKQRVPEPIKVNPLDPFDDVPEEQSIKRQLEHLDGEVVTGEEGEPTEEEAEEAEEDADDSDDDEADDDADDADEADSDPDPDDDAGEEKEDE